MKRNLLLTVFTVLLATIVSPAAHADTVYFNLNTPIVTANPGDTVDFTAGIAELDGFYFLLNGDAYSLQGGLAIDDSGLFLNFDQFFDSYQFDSGVLFSVTLPSNIPSGTYLGSFTLLGGFGITDMDELASQNFQITTVNTNVNPVPEPSSLLLLSSGILTAAVGFKRKWRNA